MNSAESRKIVAACQQIKAYADRVQAEATRLASVADKIVMRSRAREIQRAAIELGELLSEQ